MEGAGTWVVAQQRQGGAPEMRTDFLLLGLGSASWAHQSPHLRMTTEDQQGSLGKFTNKLNFNLVLTVITLLKPAFNLYSC